MMKKKDASDYIWTYNQWNNSINEKPYINEINALKSINQKSLTSF